MSWSPPSGPFWVGTESGSLVLSVPQRNVQIKGDHTYPPPPPFEGKSYNSFRREFLHVFQEASSEA